ncbi:hypothetical protein SynSYN20_01564 [Synechococcus sp. SYN20]|nr:hypothetical protein SynSYN20_01564 [Synechococcus sp. SYN20]
MSAFGKHLRPDRQAPGEAGQDHQATHPGRPGQLITFFFFFNGNRLTFLLA